MREPEDGAVSAGQRHNPYDEWITPVREGRDSEFRAKYKALRERLCPYYCGAEVELLEPAGSLGGYEYFGGARLRRGSHEDSVWVGDLVCMWNHGHMPLVIGAVVRNTRCMHVFLALSTHRTILASSISASDCRKAWDHVPGFQPPANFADFRHLWLPVPRTLVNEAESIHEVMWVCPRDVDASTRSKYVSSVTRTQDPTAATETDGDAEAVMDLEDAVLKEIRGARDQVRQQYHGHKAAINSIRSAIGMPLK